MRRPLLLTALLLAPLATAAAPASAATVYVVRGAGFGHGIGMSQFGAYGYALHGSGYRQILAHYYRGTRLGRASSRTVRVLLQASDPFVRFRGATRVGRRRVRPASTYVVKPAGHGRLGLYTPRGKLLARFAPPTQVFRRGHVLRLLGPALNGVRSGLYRGSLLFTPGLKRGVTAVNALGIDAYVRGVVPGEMPASWHIEALKAQAVVARTYALATRKPVGVFDLFPDTRSQVYRGVSGEQLSTDAAVRSTAGQVVTHGGLPIVTYYFSTSGGHTENVENVFFTLLPEPFLQGVDDPYDGISPRHRWLRRFSSARIEDRLGGYVRGRFEKIEVLERGVSPRIIRARVVGSGGTRIITGPVLRSRLPLFDSWAYFTRVSSSEAPARASLAALLAGAPVSPARVLVGAFDPAPRGRRLVVERRVRGRWRKVGEAQTRRGGRYRAAVSEQGLYRVRSGSIAGPAVTVR